MVRFNFKNVIFMLTKVTYNHLTVIFYHSCQLKLKFILKRAINDHKKRSQNNSKGATGWVKG